MLGGQAALPLLLPPLLLLMLLMHHAELPLPSHLLQQEEGKGEERKACQEEERQQGEEPEAKEGERQQAQAARGQRQQQRQLFWQQRQRVIASFLAPGPAANLRALSSGDVNRAPVRKHTKRMGQQQGQQLLVRVCGQRAASGGNGGEGTADVGTQAWGAGGNSA